MHLRPTIAILLALIAAVPVLAQTPAEPPWDVRAFLSTYTDDGSAARPVPPTTSTWTWNFTAVRKTWACPFCGYSTYWQDATPGDDVCPNPWGLASHPANVTLARLDPKTRMLGTVSALSCDADGDRGLPLIGRPFHPGGLVEPDWNANPSPWEPTAPVDRANVASYLTARAANLNAGATPLIADGQGLRFLVIEPGSVRAAAGYAYIDPSEAVTETPTYYMTEGGPGGATPDQYTVSINPYRVSDGDVYYIRHHEENVAGATTAVEVDVYSTLYGSEFASGGQILGFASYDGTPGGCQVITNSGALRIWVPRQLAADGAGTWLLKIVIQSNTRTLPSPDEMNYNAVYGADLYTALTEPDFTAGIGADLSAGKQPYVVADTTRVPLIATADAADGVDYPVAEKTVNGTFTTDEIWPYRMPPEAAGVGRLMVQWNDLAALSAMQSATHPVDNVTVYYRTGREWYYLADLANYSTRLISNAAVANNTAIGALNYAYLDSRFMCARTDVNLTYDNWARWEPAPDAVVDHGPAELDTEDATGGLAEIIIGTLQLIGPPADGYGGEFNPGTRTPAREFTIANRSPAAMVACTDVGGCGSRYLASVYSPGDPCPACGVPLLAAPGRADVAYDAHTAPQVTVDGVERFMTPTALRFLPGLPVPMGSPDFVQEVYADLPAYQPPSVPMGATPFENDIANDIGYHGMMVAFNRPDVSAAGNDADLGWDVYFRSPNTGNTFGDPSETADVAESEMVCPVCEVRYSSLVAPTDCLYCGAALGTDTPPVPEWTLTAEEFDPFGLQVSVLRQTSLAADARIVDLGWVAPGVPATGPNTTDTSVTMAPSAQPTPVDVSSRPELTVRNEGNIDTFTEMRSGHLFRTEIDPEVRSYARWGQSVPLTVGSLFRFRPGDVAFAGPWRLFRQDATGAAGLPASALLQAGARNDTAYPGIIKPVPMGQPVGNYANELALFVDLNGNGALDFYDALAGSTTSALNEFDPDVDEPYEPVASFATRMRVVESRLPQNDFYSPDTQPAMLYDAARNNLQVLWTGQRAAPAAAGSAAPAGTSAADVPAPSDPTNILYANAALNLFGPDPLYRGWMWGTDAAGDPSDALALSISATPNERNSSPTAFADAASGTRWALWHQSLTSAAGASSLLRFDSSTTVDWDGSGATEFLFGTSGAQKGLTAFARPNAANEIWTLWHTGPAGRESIRFRPEFNPTSGVVVPDYALEVSNAAHAGQVGFFFDGTNRWLKPAQTPFTYVRDASAFGGYVGDPADPEFAMDVFFTGHIRALGNSDICWTRFNFGRPTDPNFPIVGAATNYGKVAFPRVTNPVIPSLTPAPAIHPSTRMPAIYDATGTVRGYAGEQFAASPRRQSFQSRDIDWVVSARVDDPADPAVPFNFATKPDWTGWETGGGPGLEEYVDPKFYLGVISETAGVRTQTLYALSWTTGAYDASTGLVQVTPVLTGIGAAGTFTLPLNPGHPDNDHLGELIAPSARPDATAAGAFAAAGNYEDWPSVTLSINPASGTLGWSSHLFNPDNPADPLAVFNTDNTTDLVDVVMYGDYTPYVRRVTTDQADDDSPSAFYDLGGSSRLTVFWRRSYGDTDTPHFGRPSFMHRSYTTALQLAQPPVPLGRITQVLDLTTGVEPPWALASAENGIVLIDPNATSYPGYAGHRIQVTYTDANGFTQVEQHRVVGWSIETPVPVNTVISEGPLRVVPEVYTVPGATFETVRYWLIWASARPVFDLRPETAGGQVVQQSADVYMAAVAPEYGSLIADMQVPQLGQ